MAKEIPVCLKCGDRDIRLQSVGDGLIPYWQRPEWACDVCGHIGVPLLVAVDDLPPPKIASVYEPEEAKPRTGATPAGPAGIFALLLLILSVPAAFLILENFQDWRVVVGVCVAIAGFGTWLELAKRRRRPEPSVAVTSALDERLT